MRITDSTHSLPITVSIEDREMTLQPSVVETSRGLLLFDVGMPGGIGDLADALDAEGFDIDDTWAVIITHQDVDHAGCLAAIVDRTDCLTFAHEVDTPYIEGDEELTKSTEDRSISYPATDVDVTLTGGERFRTHAGPITAVHTPGHTTGHTSYYVPDSKLLLAADALNVSDEQIVGPREDATPDMQTAWSSVETLSDLDIEQVLCYHGGFVEEGTAEIEALLHDH